MVARGGERVVARGGERGVLAPSEPAGVVAAPSGRQRRSGASPKVGTTAVVEL